jgi:hypothetical protein
MRRIEDRGGRPLPRRNDFERLVLEFLLPVDGHFGPFSVRRLFLGMSCATVHRFTRHLQLAPNVAESSDGLPLRAATAFIRVLLDYGEDHSGGGR